MVIRKPFLLLAGIVGWCGVSLLWAQPPATSPSASEPVGASATSVVQEAAQKPKPVTGGKKPAGTPVPASNRGATAKPVSPRQNPAQPSTPTQRVPGDTTAQESKVVDFTADLMRPVKVGDSSALSLVGHVVFHHNGAVITCDSAIRYNDRQMDCFKNVIINKDTIFIYGDRAEYNGFINTARIYAPLIKVVDKDAVFYTYNFSFNTLDNIGHYTGGGTMLQGENRLESQEGFYYVDSRVLVGVDDVEMENPDYRMRSDSVSYDLNAEVASFYTRSYIWNNEDEFLTAVRGDYDRKQEKYTFTDSSYILTATQEVWADTLIYHQPSGDALLLNHVQVVDEEQKALAFGDYVQYWGQERKALLTRNPVIASYETRRDSANRTVDSLAHDSLATDSLPTIDTIYMRADSLFLYTINRFDSLSQDSLTKDSLEVAGEQSVQPELLPIANGKASSDASSDTEPVAMEDDAAQAVDTPSADEALQKETEESEPMSPKEQKKAEKRKQKEAQRQAREEARRLKREQRRTALLEKMKQRATQDSIAQADSVAQIDSLQAKREAVDSTSLQQDTLSMPQTDSMSATQDSLLRQLFAYHNVRVYRTDFQAVCDSMTGFTLDSTLHMYINPVLWNDKNQVTATSVDIFTRHQLIQRAVFVGDPIMSSEVDSLHYNQIKGREIQTFFQEGKVFRTDVNGNGQTYYYLEDQDSLGRYITGFMTVECADISFYFEDQQIVRIVWRDKPVTTFYPIEKIPGTISQLLPGFKWEGARRPTREDVFDRTIRPSQRAYYRSIEQPNYPITEKIDRYREQLIKEGTWRDRNDPLSEEAIEFLQSLQSLPL